jgi:hypothetical protein
VGCRRHTDQRRSGHHNGSRTEIFQVPVFCRKTSSSAAERRVGDMSRLYRTNYGFAFSGSTISALGTHALASACCQNLASSTKISPPSVEDVANLYRKLAEIQIGEMCSRLNPAEWWSRLFKGYVFGHCLKTKRPEIFAINCQVSTTAFDVAVERIIAVPGMYYPMAAGQSRLLKCPNAKAREIRTQECSKFCRKWSAPKSNQRLADTLKWRL